ncbi:MAG: hypothetical protein KDD82_31270 [Planctomycetes bacterium]|nr:hypothetical protein [Planctomycetota bacterium]
MSGADFDPSAWERALERLSPLARQLCPPREELARDPLPAELRRHVQACPGCRDDLRDLAALLVGDPAPVGLVTRIRLWIDRARRLVEELDPGGLLPAPPPLAVAVRGEGPPAQGAARLIPFGGGALKLSYMPTPAGIDLELSAQGGAPAEFRALLGPSGKPAWEGRTALDGALRITGLEPGTYGLQVLAPGSRDPDVELTLELDDGPRPDA